MALMASNATIKDLEAMPDDGKRYELIGGSIVMTPAPAPVHQLVQGELFVRLRANCPPGHVVFIAPIDYDLPSGDRVQPDLIVVPRESVGKKRLKGPALLIVEILSPASRTNDRVLKRAAYARAGIPAYWIIDPARHQILALRLVDGVYEPYADTDGPVTFDWPLAVSFSVAELAQPPG
jgi:Uma2 family endonuclease